jgi:hypothetical protein
MNTKNDSLGCGRFARWRHRRLRRIDRATIVPALLRPRMGSVQVWIKTLVLFVRKARR